jgi:hypothetical protein
MARGERHMPEPRFEVGQDVHIARNHCPQCCELETELEHPIRVAAVLPYDDAGFAYRVQDAGGIHYEVNEKCLCTNHSGHTKNHCQHCGQEVG